MHSAAIINDGPPAGLTQALQSGGQFQVRVLFQPTGCKRPHMLTGLCDAADCSRRTGAAPIPSWAYHYL